MSQYEFLQLEIERARATVWLNRPERHNAFHEALIGELHRCFEQLAAMSAVRVIVLGARGKSFCAGADLEWMQRAAQAGFERNLEDAQRLARMLRSLARCPQPTVARVHGAAFGGGLGLVAACDIALASREASFGTTEVRLGLTPSVIAPYVLAAIGERSTRRYFQTGERFDAHEAHRLGLVHEVIETEALDARLAQMLAALEAAGPQAQAHCKQLLMQLHGRTAGEAELVEETARGLARVRAGEEAREGIAAFLAKRKPSWVP